MGLALTGCGEPISNDVFLEEAAFLAALPGAERLAPPSEIFLAPNGDAELLRAAKGASADWDQLVATLAATGDGLREASESAERSEVARRWDAVNVAHHFGAGDPLGFEATSTDWYVWGEILLIGDGTFAWTLSVASSDDVSPVWVASGLHEGTVGSITWDAEATAAALGLTPRAEVGTLDVAYVDPGPDTTTTARSLDATQSSINAVRTWAISGERTMGFDAPIAVTSDGLDWPAHATAVHAEEGGRAEGTVTDADGSHTFTSCWDADGRTVWLDGDEAIAGQGAASSCVLDDVVTADRRGAG